MIWLIVTGILVLLAILPLGVDLCYRDDGLSVQLVLGFLRVRLLPRKSKKKEKPENAPKKKAAPKTSTTQKASPEKGGNLRDFLPLVELAAKFLGSFRRKLRISRLEMKLVLAGEDPCDLAVNYGKAWTALGNLMPRLESLFVIKKRDLEVECDFTSNQTTLYARGVVTITFGRLISLLTVYGIRAVREFFKIKNQRKGGAKQ